MDKWQVDYRDTDVGFRNRRANSYENDDPKYEPVNQPIIPAFSAPPVPNASLQKEEAEYEWNYKAIALFELILILVLICGLTVMLIIYFLKVGISCNKAPSTTPSPYNDTETIFALVDSSVDGASFRELQQDFYMNYLQPTLRATNYGSKIDFRMREYDSNLLSSNQTNEDQKQKRSVNNLCGCRVAKPLYIGRTLDTLANIISEWDLTARRVIIVLMASGIGSDFKYALDRSKYLIDLGVDLIVVSLKDYNSEVQQLASDTSKSNSFVLNTQTTEKQQAVLANLIAASIETYPGPIPTTVPGGSAITVLADASVTEWTFMQETYFLAQYFNYIRKNVGISSTSFCFLTYSASFKVDDLIYAPLYPESENPVDKINTTKVPTGPIKISSTLSEFYYGCLENKTAQSNTVVLIASETGDDFSDALGPVKLMLNMGAHVIIVAMNKEFDSLKHIATCDGCAFDAPFISEGRKPAMDELARQVGKLSVGPSHPSGTTTWPYYGHAAQLRSCSLWATLLWILIGYYMCRLRL